MKSFWTWFARSPIASALRVFVAVVLGQMVTEWARVGNFDFTNYKLWLITALVASVPTILRWINPEDNAFGAGKQDSQMAVVPN